MTKVTNDRKRKEIKTSRSQDKFFKPIIASSLALALGVSVGYAEPQILVGSTDGTSGNFTQSQSQSGDQSSSLGITWTNGSPQVNGSTPITNLTFEFKNDTSTIAKGDSVAADNYLITTGGQTSGTNNAIKLESTSVGILMGGGGRWFWKS